MDILHELKAIVNIPQSILKTQRFNIKIYTENNTTSELNILDEASKNKVKLPAPIVLITAHFGAIQRKFRTFSYQGDYIKQKITPVSWK